MTRGPSTSAADSALLRPKALGVQIANQLRRDILFGVLTPEDRITQEGVCARFGTSRVPVRDALQSLLHQGILIETSSGLRPARLAESDLSDMFHVEAVLHGLATKFATERANAADLAELDDYNEGMRKAANAGDVRELARANTAFHRKINLTADSPRLISALRVVTLRIEPEYLERFPERATHAHAVHRSILKAIKDRRADDASDLMFKHVMASAKTLHEAISSMRRGELDPSELSGTFAVMDSRA